MKKKIHYLWGLIYFESHGICTYIYIAKNSNNFERDSKLKAVDNLDKSGVLSLEFWYILVFLACFSVFDSVMSIQYLTFDYFLITLVQSSLT